MLENLPSGNINFIKKHFLAVIVASLLLSIAAGYFASRLTLKADFEDLLPRTFPSVKSLDKVTEKFGGTGYLVLVVESDDAVQSKKFADDLAPELESLDEVRYVDYRLPKKYFQEHSLLYLDTEDLKTIRARIDKKIRIEKQKANPFFIDLLEEEYELDFSDIEEKYTGGDVFREYYSGNDGKSLVLLIKPSRRPGDIVFSRRLLKNVGEVIGRLEPGNYHSTLKVSFTGRYKKNVDITDVINRDLKVTAVCSLIFISLLIIFYFRQIRALFIIGIPLTVSLVWTFGIARLLIGYINIITGFLAAIMLGIGVAYGIHLYNRYLEKRSGGLNAFDSIRETQSQTGKAVITAGTTTAIAFFSLMLAEFKGFSQFGLIAGISVVLSLIVFFTLFPALIFLSERLKKPGIKTIPAFKFSRRDFKFYIPVLIICIIFTGYSFFKINDIGFEYNFADLQGSNIPSFALGKKVDKMLGTSLLPAIILVDDLKEAEEVSKVLEKKERAEDTTIDRHLSLLSFLPENQAEKLDIIAGLKETVNNDLLKILKGSRREQLNDFKKLLEIKKIGIEDLPLQVRRQFLGIQEGGMAVFIFPKVDVADALMVEQVSREIKDIEISSKTLHACSETIIFADILNMITRDGKKVLLFTFFAVTLFVLIDFKSIRASIFVLSPLLVGIIWIFGAMYLLNMKFNFLNVVVFPLIFGIGVDNGVHIYHRYKEEGKGSVMFVLAHTGKAVMISCFTAMIGFSALLFARHNGLNTVGQLALIGIGSTFLVSVTFLPAVLRLSEKAKK